MGSGNDSIIYNMISFFMLIMLNACCYITNVIKFLCYLVCRCDVDVKGAMNLIEEFDEDLISIFIEPPGINDQDKRENLLERMQKRGNSNDTLIKQRLKRYDLELSFKEKFSYNFINEKLDDTTLNVEKIL